jgi:uncharacterized membrane protein
MSLSANSINILGSVLICLAPIAGYYISNPISTYLRTPLSFIIVFLISWLFLWLVCRKVSEDKKQTQKKIVSNAAIVAAIPACYFLTILILNLIPFPPLNAVNKLMNSVLGLSIVGALTVSGYQAVDRLRGCSA